MCDDETQWSDNLDHLIKKQVITAREIAQKREDKRIKLQQLEGELAKVQQTIRTNHQKLQALEHERAALQKTVETQRQQLAAAEVTRQQLESEKARLQQLVETRRQKVTRLSQKGAAGQLYLSLLNSIREAMGLLPLFTLPEDNITPAEREMAERAYGLLVEIRQALKQNQRLEAS